ncbi:oxidoreductase [Paractinoplanes deccanensis]|uniref:Oxidoreductase n=1 Tax=Paractinoplanes deccanensis TaxID=113561 RepID=A0ABQ3YBR0_9ACTN|nr:SDR family NAD(P)-dependent oxidoreductase [Actinoplanes deccanensis]GID77462.1 oxidoreductase [Actinoplanes deccanensis]
MEDRLLSGTVALVTGAGGGIGAATTRRLAREGAAVSAVARHRDRLDGVVDDVAALGGHAAAVEADLTDPAQAERAVEATLDRFGRVDILVNNAGVMLLGTALHTTVEEWDRMVALNVSALLHVTHAAVPHLIDAAATSPREVADIVNVGSAAGRAARPGSSVYTLTTSGLTGFTEALRRELVEERVRVAVVAPGFEPVRDDDVADAIAYVVTRERRVAVNEILLRAAERIW